jgi:CDP-diacylglycerol pyrophosphatase
MLRSFETPDWSDVIDHLRRILVIALAAVAAVAAYSITAAARPPKSSSSSGDSSSDSTVPSGRSALRQIVQNQCVINWEQHHDPSPCERVVLSGGKGSDSGYAILADPDGGAHYLLIPTQTMPGLDSSELLDPDLPNYFAEAWRARDLLTKFARHEVPRGAIGLVVNTAQTRSYDQFHVHIACLRQDVYDSLRQSAEQVLSAWAPLVVGGATFQARKISADGLDGSNLYELVATLKPDTARHIADYTLVAAGAQFKSGPGFIILTGTGPPGEILLDSTCAVAGGGG